MTEKYERDVLPKAFKPTHYDLEVFNIDVNKNTFQGKVKIDLDLKESSDTIVLHASNLTFNEVEVLYSITKTQTKVDVKSIDFDEKLELATLKLSEELSATASAKVILTIDYVGKINDNMNGFYRSDYKDQSNKDQVLLSTQFEATQAREALPSFDEPNLKASFQLTVTVADDFTVLSNTPVLSSKIINDGKKKGTVEASGLKVVKFESTPIQSTYLLAWAIGKLDYVETFTERSYNGKKLPVRVYTQEGISEQGRLGLEVATKVVDFFSGVFDIDYVLPKLDLVSVPAYSHNAMENWGLITFRPTALLFDEKTSDPRYKKNVAYVVAHELAHQWFGNLVTMEWWDELWLNEGFATWVGYYALEHLYPEWRIFEVYSSGELQKALHADSVRNSHPVEVPIRSSSDIGQVFDFISYSKGSSVINQIAHSLGVETFLKGVSHYLKKNKFSNGSTNDLLSSISQVSGVDVLAQADNWIRKIGYPYVTVETNEDGDVTFSQKRFLLSGDASEDEDQTIWYIPLNISTGKGSDEVIKDISLTTRALTLKGFAKEHPFFKVNKDSYGFYRTVYDSGLSQSISENLDKLSATDKVNLITDSVTTAIAGLSKTSDALNLLKNFKGETDYVVWTAILDRFDLLISTWFEQPENVQIGLKKFLAELVGPTALSLGFEASSADDYLITQLRTEILQSAIKAGIPEVTSQAKELFSKGESSFDPSLKGLIYSAVVSDPSATEEDYESVFDIIKTSKSLDAKETVLKALSSVTNPKLITKTLNLILSPEVPVMDVQFISNNIPKNGKAKQEFWKFLQTNYDAVYERLATNKVVFERFIKFSLGHYSSEESHNSIKDFFKDKNKDGFERSLEQVLDYVQTHASWVTRDASDVEAWLKEENYI